MKENRLLKDLSENELKEIWNLWQYSKLNMHPSSICKRYNISMEVLNEVKKNRPNRNVSRKLKGGVKRSDLTIVEKQDIRDLFLANESVHLVAEKFDISWHTAKSYKFRLTARKKNKIQLTQDQRRKLMILVGKGFSSEDIAAHFGISLEQLEIVKKSKIIIKRYE